MVQVRESDEDETIEELTERWIIHRIADGVSERTLIAEIAAIESTRGEAPQHEPRRSTDRGVDPVAFT